MTPHRLGIAALHRAYAAGETTPSEVLAATLARMAALNPALLAVTDLDPTSAAGAVESDRRVRNGAMRELEGVTIGIKANVAVAGLPWTAGLAARREVIAEHDAPVVARLRAAGAIVVGTLNMHEAALGATTDNPFYGRTGNPHREGVTPGGSSGGSGAAVAAGLCVAALGTDTLGSIRIPAAYDGVYGLKPTHGAVDDTDVVPCARWLDVVGPLARSLDDLERVWALLSPCHPRERGDDGRAGRVVLLADLGGVAVEFADRAAYDRAVAALDLPRASLALPDPATAIRLAGFVAAGRELAPTLPDRTTLSPELRFMLDFCDRATPAPDVLDRTRAAVLAALGDDGVLLLPTTPQAAFAHGRAPVDQADFTGLANIAGCPALALPAGRDASGLPVGVQLVGPPGSEARLFALARTLDAALDGYAPPPGF